MNNKTGSLIPLKSIPAIDTHNSCIDKCGSCNNAKCCQYSTIKIETPHSIRDFDQLLWHISHINTQLFKDSDGWFLIIINRCEHLSTEGSCNIYETRPFTCREHSNEYCEQDSPIEENCQLYFHNHKSLDTYCRNRFKSWDKRFNKKQP